MGSATARAKRKSPPPEKVNPHDVLAERLKRTLIQQYPDQKGRIDPRFLWVSQDVYRFRVNWWVLKGSVEFIAKSIFVYVQDEKDGLIVQEKP